MAAGEEQPTADTPGALGDREACREQPGDAIGPYTLLREIGRGGFGVVWLAERREPFVQRVALKVIKPGVGFDGEVRRFERERQTLALMEHPNIARVFDGGQTPSGMPYFVMEHVNGEPITEFCDRHRFTIRDRLLLMVTVCEAVQHAHLRGIIHRDLSPRNILVGLVDHPTGARSGAESTDDDWRMVPASAATVKIIDFGIAKSVGGGGHDLRRTVPGLEPFGTPEYMSPEQATGRLDIDARSDVYALGCVLYTLLIGEPPFRSQDLRSGNREQISRIIREVDPPLLGERLDSIGVSPRYKLAEQRRCTPEQLEHNLQHDLTWIVAFAMHKSPIDRYQSPIDLSRDISRFLSGEMPAILASVRRYRARQFVRRHRTAITSVIAVSLVILLMSLTSSRWVGLVAVPLQRALQNSAAVQAAEKYVVSIGKNLKSKRKTGLVVVGVGGAGAAGIAALTRKRRKTDGTSGDQETRNTE